MNPTATRQRRRQPERWTALDPDEQIAIVRSHLAQAEQGSGAQSVTFWRSRLRFLEGAQVDDGQV